LQIISLYEKLFHFKNFIIYGNLDAEEGHSVEPSYEHRIVQKFGRPVIIAGSETDSLHNLINWHSYVVVFFTDICDPLLDEVRNTTTRIPFLPIQFEHRSSDNLPLTAPEIESFFKWCLKNNLYYVTLICYHNDKYKIWAYEFKSKLTIVAVTKQAIRDLKQRDIGLMHRQQLTISAYQSVPDVFVRDITGGNKSLGGQTGIMIAELIRYVKGTMRILQIPNNKVNVTADIRANMERKHGVGYHSPSIKLTKFCLVVPYERRINFREYVRKVHGNKSMLLFFAFYVAVNTVIQKLSNPHISLYTLITGSLNLYYFQPMLNREVKRMRIAEKIMMISIMIYNLEIAAITCGALTTSFTTGYLMPEIVDIDSLLASDLRIMVPTPRDMFKYETVTKELFKKMFFVDQSTRDHHLNTLNDSFLYIVETHKWPQYEFAQRRLRQPKLKLVSEPLCGTSHHLGLPVRPKLPLTIKLSYFTRQISETGLDEKWMEMGLEQMKRANLIKQHPYDPPTHIPLNLEFFTLVFRVFLICLCLSVVVFFFECILKRSS
ncbi:hypothetical protein KR044_007591, partial [Drosophila immigrans]